MDKIDYSKSDDWMKDRDYIRQFVNLVKLDKNNYVLDAGCGSGYVAEEVRPKVKDVLQIDYDWAMLSKNAMVHHASTLRTSILDLWMIKDSVFDAIFCRSVLHRLENPEKAYSELIRVLKPRGKIVASVSHLPEEVAEEYKKMMSSKGKRSYLTQSEWRSLLLKKNDVKIIKEGKIKFNINLNVWGLLKEHENASESFRKFFKLKNGIIECSHAYFIIEKL
ncbi:MAG: class I SAM-dependent methyltransferase [Nanoarchaeota archaeon]